jgi:bifunctional DNA-binding transcriptional regulator/antitoxin component of YhaV-PrlF toxin-antitoxin module
MNPKVKVKGERKGRTSSSRLSAKNQVTVPIEIMRVAGFEVGDQIHFKVEEGRVVIEKDKPKITNLFGIGNGFYDDFDFDKERREAWGE